MSKFFLDGEWAFVGAERRECGVWTASDRYVEYLTWGFYPKMIDATMIYGVVVERNPEGLSIKMNYTYDPCHKRISIETGVDDVDLYDLVIGDDSSHISIEIVDESSDLRYLLCRV